MFITAEVGGCYNHNIFRNTIIQTVHTFQREALNKIYLINTQASPEVF